MDQSAQNSVKNSIREALILVKENRKAFFKACRKHNPERAILVYLQQPLVSGWISTLSTKYKHNPNLLSELVILGNSLADMGFREAIWPEVLEELHDKYMDRIDTQIAERAAANGGYFKFEDKTKAVHEHILRGFVHKDTFPVDPRKDYTVVCNIAPLIYPKVFPHHNAAVEIQRKFGIPGYTGTTILKK